MTSLSNSAGKYLTEISEKSKSEEQAEIKCLLENLPVLDRYFHLHSKIGQGTFSTVYLATLKNETFTQKYAVKHLSQTCEQSQIQNEFKCMQEIGGADNVVSADLCLRNGRDCVTFVMPYLAHQRFSDYVVHMDAEETRVYMKNLFIALKRVHSFNIIHRDVKPNNFLYNRETKRFLLVDFGLAERVRVPNQETNTGSPTIDENKPIDYSKKNKRPVCSSDDEKATPVNESKRIALKSKDGNVKILAVPRTPDENKAEVDKAVTRGKGDQNSPLRQWTDKPDVGETPIKARIFNFTNTPSGSRRKLLDPRGAGTSKSFNFFKNQPKSKKTTENSVNYLQGNSFSSLASPKSSSVSFAQVKNTKLSRQQTFSSTYKPTTSPSLQSCPCSGKAAVCSICSSRPPMWAPRSGTSGFRPPEVLFKYLYQTTAVDMWASGVVMLSILSGCYPFFNSSTDLASLAEIMTIFGTERTINVAKKFGRRILCSEYRKEIDLKKLCKRLRARSDGKSRIGKSISNEPKCRDCFQAIRDDGCICRSDDTSSGPDVINSNGRFPDSAYDLLYRLLDLDPTTRITAAEALKHPFITGQS